MREDTFKPDEEVLIILAAELGLFPILSPEAETTHPKPELKSPSKPAEGAPLT